MSIGAPASILRIVEGYAIPFSRSPPLSLPLASAFTILRQPDQISVVDEEVASLLQKGAIEEVLPTTRGYFSKIFCVPKPVGWRPIINLKRLNADYVICPHFRMDTTKDVASLLRPGDWAASIDL